MIKVDKIQILKYFLNIFKVQQNASGRPGKIIPLCQTNGDDAIYELQTERYGKQVSRRITIGPLGEDSGSKSTCFKVIYDDILVVKIPPAPIRDFATYIKNIHAEKKITDHLSPDINCIIPSVSAILKKIQPFSNESCPDPGLFEERCIEKLKILQKYQNFLKIGDSFAFFMNLSTYSFLGQVIRDIHSVKDRMLHEVLSRIDMLEHPGLFEDIYGHDALLFYDISEIYLKYEADLNPLLTEYGPSSVSAYDKKEWFLIHLAEKKVENEKLPPEFINKLNKLIHSKLAADKNVVQKFRRIIKNHIYHIKFKQNKAAIEGIIINLLKMLAILREKGVAVRDLKPDNVFVVGDLSTNPHLLASPGEYSIGLIDFETSVKYKTEAGEGISQPMLAGTPSYATPSHLFKNEILCYVYKDLARILHIQDWQAVNSMIYNVITGSRLSQETSKLIPSIVRTIKKTGKNTANPEVFLNCNQIFWHKAAGEFTEKLSKYKAVLLAVSIKIPESAKSMLIEEALEINSYISRRIQNIVYSQKLFSTTKSREELISSSFDAVSRYKANWEKGINIPRINPAVRKQVIKLLKDIERLKRDYENMMKFINKMEASLSIISAYELMRFIFNVVLNNMYQTESAGLQKEDRDIQNNIDNDLVSHEESVAIESTIHTM